MKKFKFIAILNCFLLGMLFSGSGMADGHGLLLSYTITSPCGTTPSTDTDKV